jgi:hypothetical protein
MDEGARVGDAAVMDWQRRWLDQERAVNEELRRTDPEAYQAKMEAKLPTNTCCFCRETFRGYGNNPSPVLEEGTACDACNDCISITARIQTMSKVYEKRRVVKGGGKQRA